MKFTCLYALRYVEQPKDKLSSYVTDQIIVFTGRRQAMRMRKWFAENAGIKVVIEKFVREGI